jgi:purine-binding chemotaxis protein CheW
MATEHSALSSEQALEDYFTALLDLEPEADIDEPQLKVQREDDTSGLPSSEPELQPCEFEEPTVEVERQIAKPLEELSSPSMVVEPKESPNLESLQRLFSGLEPAQVQAEPVVDTTTVTTQTEEIQEWAVEIDTRPTIEAKVEIEPIDTSLHQSEIQTESSHEAELQVETESVESTWKNGERTEGFQVLYFDVNGVTFAVPLDELGGIHKLGEVSHLIGRPGWYLGLQSSRENQLDVVDTARWVMPDKLTDDEHREHYEFIVMLGESNWGLASTELKGTETLSPEAVRWREKAGKRPWLAGMVKEQMCALVHTDELITMLNAGLDVTSLQH